MLELTDVHSFYGAAHVIRGVSLNVGRGEVVALLGRNGMGKTTTLRTIMACAAAGEIGKHSLGRCEPARPHRA